MVKIIWLSNRECLVLSGLIYKDVMVNKDIVILSRS